MSTVERITQLSHRIFNTSVSERNVARQSNPFAASNFQKNILTEDVFESHKSKEHNQVNFTGNLSAHSKRMYSMLVGSISNFGEMISGGIESIVRFGNRMKDGIVNTWNRISEIGNKEVSLDGIKKVLSQDVTHWLGRSREKEIEKLSKMNPTMEVKPMLVEALSALEADMVQVA